MDNQEQTVEATAVEETQKVSVLSKIKNAPKRTKLIGGGIIAAVVISGGAGAYAYYQSPDTVVAQAFVSLVTASNPSYEMDLGLDSSAAKGTLKLFTYSSDKGSALEMNLNTEFAGQEASATLNAVIDKDGGTYLNLANFSSLATLLANMGYVPASAVDALSSALTNTWVKVDSKDLGQGNSALGGAGECLSPTQSSEISSELQSSLRNNFFVKVKNELAQEEGNRVFVLTLDAQKLRSFLTSVKASKAYLAIQKCSPNIAISDSMIESITQANIDEGLEKSGVTVKIYANALNHSMAKITAVVSLSPGQTLNMTFIPNGSHPEKVVIPEQSVSYTELLSTIYSAILGG